MWIKEIECLEVVRESWSSLGARSIMEKIHYTSLKLEKWGGGRVKQMVDKIKNFQRQLRQLRSRRDAYRVNKYNEIKWEYLSYWNNKGCIASKGPKNLVEKRGSKLSIFFTILHLEGEEIIN